MIYSIGYQGMVSSQVLAQELVKRGVTALVDVRSKPYSRWKPTFNRPRLNIDLKKHHVCYFWKGDVLGGFGTIRDETLSALAKWSRDKTICLMCMEKDPEKCHRKYEIGFRLAQFGIEIEHIQL